MQELKKKYDELRDSYAALLAEIHEKESGGLLTRVFATQDIFSPEPFYQQMNNISERKMKSYTDKADLPGSLDVYEFLLEDGDVIYSRHTDLVDMVKDSFYVTVGNCKWDYQFYISSSTEITNVLCLTYDEAGRALEYAFFNKFGWFSKEYNYLGPVVMISTGSSATDGKNETKVTLDEDLHTVKKIEHLYAGGNIIEYELKKTKVTETALLKKIKQAIINSTLKMLKQQNSVKNKIAFLIFAYDFDMPFNPEVGLCQSAEVKSLSKFGPLVHYSVGDMEYFGLPDLYIHPEKETDLSFETFHQQIESKYEYAEKKAFIIKAYVDICKKLMQHDEIKKYMPVADDFYVLAYDSSELNVDVFLKALFPETHYKTFLKQQAAEAESRPFKER